MSYHSSKTGKFVTKEYAEANPDTTVKLSHVNLKKELLDFAEFLGDSYVDEDMVEEYLKSKDQ